MRKFVYALGFFDGVHRGHAELLRRCRELAGGSLEPGVVTFGNHPDTLVLGVTPGLINTPADRERLLREIGGTQRVVELPFDKQLCAMAWDAFLDMLRETYDAAGFVCGEDFRFGAKGFGTADTLAAYCRERGLPWAVVPEQLCRGERISSTRIRELLETGDMEQAAEFLGHPHILTGTVIHGHQLGRRLGIPTANLALPEGLAEPRHGVYACRVWLEGGACAAVTNIGTRPTVEGRGVTVEPWILDYAGDLYGKEIRLEFLRFLRPERKFPDLESLKAEILRNAAETREIVQN